MKEADGSGASRKVQRAERGVRACASRKEVAHEHTHVERDRKSQCVLDCGTMLLLAMRVIEKS